MGAQDGDRSIGPNLMMHTHLVEGVAARRVTGVVRELGKFFVGEEH